VADLRAGRLPRADGGAARLRQGSRGAPGEKPVFRLLKPLMSGHSYDTGKFFQWKKGRLLITPALVVLLSSSRPTSCSRSTRSPPCSRSPPTRSSCTRRMLSRFWAAFAVLGHRQVDRDLPVPAPRPRRHPGLHRGQDADLALVHMPVGVTLGVVVTVLSSTVVSSIWMQKVALNKKKKHAGHRPPTPAPDGATPLRVVSA